MGSSLEHQYDKTERMCEEVFRASNLALRTAETARNSARPVEWGATEKHPRPRRPGLNGPLSAAVHCTFETMDQFNAAMGDAGTGAVIADVANYTNIAPVIQVSEIVG
jgi:hypothetical protein